MSYLYIYNLRLERLVEQWTKGTLDNDETEIRTNLRQGLGCGMKRTRLDAAFRKFRVCRALCSKKKKRIISRSGKQKDKAHGALEAGAFALLFIARSRMHFVFAHEQNRKSTRVNAQYLQEYCCIWSHRCSSIMRQKQALNARILLKLNCSLDSTVSLQSLFGLCDER